MAVRLRVSVAALVLLAAAAAALGGWFVRASVIEPEALGALCQGAGGPWWCAPRLALILATALYGALGIAALAAAGLAFVFGGRAARALVVAAALLGGAGLTLYNAGLAAPAVLLALLRGARLEPDQPVRRVPQRP